MVGPALGNFLQDMNARGATGERLPQVVKPREEAL